MICTLNAKNRVGWEIFHLIKQKLRSGYPAACWQPKQPNQDGSLEFWGSVNSSCTSFFLGSDEVVNFQFCKQCNA